MMRLKSVDFPTFGRPTSATSGFVIETSSVVAAAAAAARWWRPVALFS
jgi:hypothetical protein